MIKHRFYRIESQSNVCSILARGVLILKARREGQSNESLLPFIRERGVVSVTPAQHNAAELRNNPKCEFENFGACIVTIDQNSNARLAGEGRRNHPSYSKR
ncbi:hypothetical protein PROAA_20047 [Candidatus Propionivibrio aalborgensis]|uniref:Uncharacterized protein n=1 Tax=Candidatus Propionivibrio aalborgensis TaxID=1860101 RepID=A0A1A8XP18_9RHOO|nr:hypothetical protein PROAA_20047 [Candidatus Propionivibrio aalborgensis]